MRQLTDHRAMDETPCWSPDGTRIAYASSRDGEFGVYAQGVDGGAPRRLSEHGVRSWAPHWGGPPSLSVFAAAKRLLPWGSIKSR